MENNTLLMHALQTVEVGQRFKLRVTGYSMLPLLGYDLDEIVLRRVDESEDILGRIAMFYAASGNIVVHRVIEQRQGVVTLRGDGNLYGTEQCSRHEIVGVVDEVVRRGGRVVSCTTRMWHLRERLWLSLPLFVRRYLLAVMRRWLEFRRK